MTTAFLANGNYIYILSGQEENPMHFPPEEHNHFLKIPLDVEESFPTMIKMIKALYWSFLGHRKY